MYEPREDSFLLLKHIKDYAKGDVLDMGTGSGILAIEASKFAEKVIATDIDQELIARLKFRYKQIKFICSDLFKNKLLTNKRFDLIIFNPPYLPQDKGIENDTICGGEKGYEIIGKFLNKVKKYLKKDGKVLLLFSSHTGLKNIKNIIKKNKLTYEQIDSKKLFFETLYLYLIYTSG